MLQLRKSSRSEWRSTVAQTVAHAIGLNAVLRNFLQMPIKRMMFNCSDMQFGAA